MSLFCGTFCNTNCKDLGVCAFAEYMSSCTIHSPFVVHRLVEPWLLAATKQLYKWPCPYVRLSVLVHHTFTMILSQYSHEFSMNNYLWQKWCPGKRSRSEAKDQGHTQGSKQNFNSNMATKWYSKLQVGQKRCPSYCFSRSSVQFQGETAPKLDNFTMVSVCLVDNPSFNSQMANKWCMKLWRISEWCHIVFFKVIRTITMSHWPKITNLVDFSVSRG